MKSINTAYLASIIAQIEESKVFHKTPFENRFKEVSDLAQFANRFPSGEEVLKHVAVQKKMQRSKRLHRSAYLLVESVSLISEVEDFFNEDITLLNLEECQPDSPNSIYLDYSNLKLKGHFTLSCAQAAA